MLTIRLVRSIQPRITRFEGDEDGVVAWETFRPLSTNIKMHSSEYVHMHERASIARAEKIEDSTSV